MARKKKNDHIVLEDVELKPQVIGYTYQKKSNIGRVIFIFVAFLLVVYFINDISIFINNLIGKNSADTIQSLAGNNNKNNDDDKDNKKNEIIYNIYSNNLIITEGNMTFNNFNYTTNSLSFDISNNSNENIDYSAKKYFIETYSENKTLLERFKLNINSISSNSKMIYQLDVTKDFYYIVVEEKTIEDYPIVNLSADAEGVALLTCTKDNINILYTFKNNELTTIKETVSDSNINDEGYYTRYNSYLNKTNSYNKISGITGTFNGTLNGYTAVIAIDLANADLNTTTEKYYYGYKEIPKVVKFEMQTYGFNCN